MLWGSCGTGGNVVIVDNDSDLGAYVFLITFTSLTFFDIPVLIVLCVLSNEISGGPTQTSLVLEAGTFMYPSLMLIFTYVYIFFCFLFSIVFQEFNMISPLIFE